MNPHANLQKIYLQVTNNQDFETKVSLLGGLNDPMAVSSNASTQYQWDLTTENFQGDKDKITIQYKKVGAAAFITASAPLPQQSWEGALAALNSLGLGFFFQDGVYLVTFNDTYVFGNFSVLG